jgi:hypothetical protein
MILSKTKIALIILTGLAFIIVEFILEARPPLGTRPPIYMCQRNLRAIKSWKQSWQADMNKPGNVAPTWDDLKAYIGPEETWKTEIPKCPSEGVYTLGRLDEDPTCSIPTHRLPNDAK